MRMRRLITALVVMVTGAGLLAPAASACTRILWNDSGKGVLVSRSMDWEGSSDPRLVVLPRGMQRDGGKFGSATVVTENPARWTSRIGSVVVTSNNLGTPDGMNEKGLGVHALWLNATDYGARDPQKAGIQATLWAQYLLDNAATVNEALALQQGIQPVSVSLGSVRVPLSLAIEDASGDSAILQYIGGQLVVHHGPQYRVLANDPDYDKALADLAQYDFTNATRDIPLPGNTNSHDRFVRANFYIDFLRSTKPRTVREAEASLLSVARNVSDPIGAPYDTPGVVDETDYRTLANLTARVYYFEPSRGLNILRTDLRKLNFAKGAPVLTLNPDDPALFGNVTGDYRPAKRAPFTGKA